MAERRSRAAHERGDRSFWTIREEELPAFAELEAAWVKQACDTRAALESVRDWRKEIEYRVTDDEGRRKIVTTSAGGLFTQLAFHEVHHRAQVMALLREHGVTLDDIDFNSTMFTRRDTD